MTSETGECLSFTAIKRNEIICRKLVVRKLEMHGSPWRETSSRWL